MERAERKEAKHGHTRAWLEATLDSIADAVIATDDKRAVKCMNPVAEQLTGWTLKQALVQRARGGIKSCCRPLAAAWDRPSRSS
jgi:nitrogen fixation/metabolism regulation signal transduction histidine kinase